MAKGKTCETGKSAASVFKAIDDLLRTPGGNCNTSIDYMEQTSWLLFLRYLDAREGERRDEAILRVRRLYDDAVRTRGRDALLRVRRLYDDAVRTRGRDALLRVRRLYDDAVRTRGSASLPSEAFR